MIRRVVKGRVTEAVKVMDRRKMAARDEVCQGGGDECCEGVTVRESEVT